MSWFSSCKYDTDLRTVCPGTDNFAQKTGENRFPQPSARAPTAAAGPNAEHPGAWVRRGVFKQSRPVPCPRSEPTTTHYVRFLLYVLLLLGLLGAGTYFWFQRALHRPVEHDSASEYITVETGWGASRILDLLETRGILAGTVAPKLYLRFVDNTLRPEAGDYQFPSPISAYEVLRKLENGKRRAKTITLPEGWTRFEIAERLHAQLPVDSTLAVADVLAFMDHTEPIRTFDPAAENLEGYLFPTTYDFDPTTHPRAAVERLVAQFLKNWQPEWETRARALGRSNRDVVIIASLIESESKVDDELPRVASVIYNRLRLGMPLGIDATNVYIAKLLGRWDGIIHKSDVEVDHPYNTRRISGLPPGPICSPGRRALEAALYPDSTAYLYYVLNVDANDGSHHFYANARDFSRGKAQYQRWLRQQR